MKRPDRVTAVFGAIVLTAVVAVGGFSAYAAGGDQTDPLVTLSYLTQVVTPDLLKKVDEKVAANEQALTGKIDAAINEYSKKIEQSLSSGTGQSSAYSAASVPVGRTILPQAGCEIILRSGSASVSVGGSPALLDTTAASSLTVGGALKANHLYVAAQDGAGILVTADAVFLVRGTYTVS